MSQVEHDASGDATFQSIMAALTACYGDLAAPNFRKAYAGMESSLHRQLIEDLRAKGIEITETTDQDDDVATHLAAGQGGNEVGLMLSGVGPFAALLHQDGDGRYCWVTRPDKAPTPLAALIATTVERAGFQLLNRDTVTRTIAMNRADGATEATLYQALFTDSDVIP